MILPPPISTLFPYTTLFRSLEGLAGLEGGADLGGAAGLARTAAAAAVCAWLGASVLRTRHVAKVRRCRSEEHTSELQSLRHLVCRLLLEKKKKTTEQCRISK